MTASPVDPGFDRMLDGYREVWFCPAIADMAAPKVSEIVAGVRLGSYLTKDGANLKIEGGSVDTTPMVATVETSAPGVDSFDGSLIAKRTTVDAAYTTLKGKPKGYIVDRRGLAWDAALVATNKVDVYKVQCGNANKITGGANETEKFEVKLHNQGTPKIEVAVVP